MPNKSVLVLSDIHAPYSHDNLMPFLKAIKKKYKPDRVVCIGDEIDGHAWSFHDTDPSLYGPEHELDAAIKMLQPVYQLFPKVDVVDSNHGSLIYRKQIHHGLPSQAIKDYRSIIEAPKGWAWSFDLTLKMSNGELVYFCHGKSKNAIKLSQSMGMSTVNGHFHEDFSINYWGSPTGLYFSMVVGCLIDDDSRAFSYNNTNLKRPIIGCGIILNGQPRLLPMVLNKNGKWDGKCP